jgi:hypothetical protein
MTERAWIIRVQVGEEVTGYVTGFGGVHAEQLQAKCYTHVEGIAVAKRLKGTCPGLRFIVTSDL